MKQIKISTRFFLKSRCFCLKTKNDKAIKNDYNFGKIAEINKYISNKLNSFLENNHNLKKISDEFGIDYPIIKGEVMENVK